VRFLVDAQLPPALARWLVEQRYLAEHVYDLGMASADDRVIWEYLVRGEASCRVVGIQADTRRLRSRHRAVS
jgi:predicted nuclease of predicted toxin-antitoxin system